MEKAQTASQIEDLVKTVNEVENSSVSMKQSLPLKF